MNRSSAPTRALPRLAHAGGDRRADAGVPLLHGRALALAQAWWVAAVAIVGMVLVALPLRLAQLRTICTGEGCGNLQLAPDALRTLQASGLSLDVRAAWVLALEAGYAAACFSLGALIVRRRGAERMALFTACFLLAWGATFPSGLLRALAASYPAWRLPVALVFGLGVAFFELFLCLFPDGRFVPRWTRWAAAGWIVLAVAGELLSGTPLGIASWPPALTAALHLGLLGTGVYAQVYRYRRVSGTVARQQTKWFVWGAAMGIGGFLAIFLLIVLLPGVRPPGTISELVIETGFSGAMLLIPLSMGVAILRHRLFDIDFVINRTLVYGGLTACVIGLYVLIVGGAGVLFRTGGNLVVSLVATGLVAVLFQPLRERLQRGVNRLLYGERDEPYAVLARLGRRLGETLAPQAVPPAIVETLAQALKLPYAALTLRQDEAFTVVAASGAPVANPLRLPLVYQTETVGELLLAPRAPREGFSPADRRLLDQIAYQTGVAMHAVRLTADLQRSRERLVTAREEERRRLRRDLHDGLGPALGGLGLKLELAHDLIFSDPAAAAELLVHLQAQTQEAVADIRRLVYALRPPALDQLGLVGALREAAAGYEQRGQDGRSPRIIIDAPASLPPLPAAVEVAAYRIALEALTNVVRHADASTCTIRLALDVEADVMVVEVVDDGRGLPDAPAGGQPRAGVGLASMRERAAELGGTCVVESGRGPSGRGGTRVRALLPSTPPAAPARGVEGA